MAVVNGSVSLMNGDGGRCLSAVDSSADVVTNVDFQKNEACDQLMQRIRRRQNAKSWSELIKISRSSLHDKRNSFLIDPVDRVQLQKCLDTMQKSIKVTSLQSMVERLETITRQLGLKFTVGPSGQDVFISSDMFYVEVVLEPTNGYVLDVKIAHHADPVSCAELTRVLRDADFSEFHRHLDGLTAIYQLNTDKKQKIKAYLALHALEADLSLLAQIQSSINDPNNLVHKSPVGILLPRRGGHPMQLTYFISPYELLDSNGDTLPLSVDVVNNRRLGFHVKVCIEPTPTSHKLQTTSLLSITKTHEGRSLPQFAALNATNSCSLPACFVLRLPQPLPISLETLAEIRTITGIDIFPIDSNRSQPRSLLDLIAAQQLDQSDSKCTSSPFTIQLPDQAHAYFASSDSSSCCWTQQEAIEINCIPFDHPTCVPQILSHLRQQVLFNVLVGSCIRRSSFLCKTASKQIKHERMHMFELSASSIFSVSVSFEHPVEQSLATIDFDLKDITSVRARLYESNRFAEFCSDEFASKVMQRCLSIPITMRSIIKRCQEKATQLKNERRQKELANTASLPSTNEVLYTPTAADQNMISGNGVSFQSQITDEPRLNHLPASNLENANYLTSNYSQMNNNSIVHQSHAMHNNSQMQPQHHSNHQQQQHQHPQQHQQHTPHQQFSQQHSQQMVHHQPQANYASNVMQTPVMAMGSHGSNKQMHSQAQKSSNAMLMTMLSDVPAANSQQFSTYAYQAQNAAFQQQQQQQPNAGQMNAMQIGQVKAKKPRKRKGTNGSTGMSPAGTDMPIKGVGGNILCLPSPKRKVSEDDFGRDMAATPSNSDLMDSAVGYDAFAGSGGQLPRPPSTASSMLKCEPPGENMSAGPLMHSQLGQALNSPQLNHPNAMSQAHHYPQHSLQPQSHHPPLPATTSLVFKNSLENSTTGSGNVTSNALDIGSISPFGSKNGANFLGNSTFDLKRKALTGEAGIGGAMGSSNDNGLSNTASNALGGEMIPNVLSNHHLDQLSSTGSQSYPPSAVSRAISNNQNSNLDNVNRKERKRKRPDTNDSLMPPPTSTGYVPPTSGQDHLDHSLSVVGSPALRPITLNVKPVANANAIMINNSANKMNERSPTLKSKPSNSPKSNDSDSNSSASGSSPRSSPKLTSKQLKNKTLSAMLTSQQKMKNVQPIGPALNAAKTSTVNSGGFAISGNVSPSASSNISLMSAFHQANNSSSQTHPLVPSPSSAPPSSSNVGASNSSSSNSPLTASPSGLSPVSPGFKNGALSKSNSMHKKSKGSLSAVIDKLRVTASTGGDEQSSTSTILSSSQHATSDTGKFVQLNNGANVLSTNSSNSLSSGNTSVSCSSIGQSPLNATTGTSNNGNISAAKLPDAKLKHNRPEFTVKQSLGGTLKLTVTKTKGQGGVGSSGSLHSNKLASKTSSGIKRQWQSGGNFKNGQSSSLTQKQQQQQQRPLSPESADQILEAALPKIQLDKLPKIPKTASSQNQVNPSNAFNSGPGSIGTTAAAANPSAAFKGNMGTNKYGALNKHSLSLRQQLQHNNSNIALMQSSSAGSTMAGTLMPPPPISSHYRKFGPRELPPPHLLQSHSPSSSSPSVSHPIPFSSSDTQPPPYHPVSSSGSRLERIFAFKMDAAANSTNDPRLQMKYNESSSNLSSLSAASSNSNFIPNSIVVTSSSSSSAAPSSSFGINSSVLVSAASSTPSSPLECGGPTDGNPKTPTLIPTERLSLEESNLNDPLKLNQIHPTSTSNVSSSLKEPKFISKLATVTTIDDDDDTERLTIDVPALSCSTATAASSSKDANPMKVKPRPFDISTTTTSATSESLSCNLIGQDLTDVSICNSVHSTTSSVSTLSSTSNAWKRSPCVIDDDLMDEALIGTTD